MASVSRSILLGTGLNYHLTEWGYTDPSLEHTVILIHGFLDIGWGWSPVVEAGLAGKYHVVAPDMRGHGDTDRVGPGGYYHFSDYLPDIHEVVKAVGRKKVSFVGHSMGGSIAAYYTGTYPERVDRLALLEGTGPPEMGEAGPERVKAWIEGWERVRAKERKAYATVEEAAARLRQTDAMLSEELSLRLAAKGTTKGYDRLYRFKHDPLHATLGPHAFELAVAQRFWRAVKCPVLLIEGAESGFRHPPEEAARREGCFARATKIVIPGAGHAMHWHQPQAVARALLEFLGS